MLEFIVFGLFIAYILYAITYAAIKGRYFESFLAAGVGILTTEIFLVANHDGEFFREGVTRSLNIALQGFGLFLIVASAGLLISAFLSKRKISGIVSEFGSTHLFLTQGVYGVIRHPVQLGGILAAIGIACMMANSGIIIFALLASAAFFASGLEEDKHNAGSLGAEYHDYVAAVPAYNLASGIVRLRRK